MSRFKTTQYKIAAKGKSGPIRYELQFQDKALALFTGPERKAIIGEAMRKGGVVWVAFFFPRRFTDYARSLGYSVSAKYEKFKRRLYGNALPLVGVPVKGQSAKLMEQTPRVSATSTTTKQYVEIKIPIPHPMAAIVYKVLKTIPAEEVQTIAKEVGRTLREIINNADHPDATRSRLTAPMRASLGIKPRTTSGTPTRRTRKAA